MKNFIGLLVFAMIQTTLLFAQGPCTLNGPGATPSGTGDAPINLNCDSSQPTVVTGTYYFTGDNCSDCVSNSPFQWDILHGSVIITEDNADDNVTFSSGFIAGEVLSASSSSIQIRWTCTPDYSGECPPQSPNVQPTPITIHLYCGSGSNEAVNSDIWFTCGSPDDNSGCPSCPVDCEVSVNTSEHNGLNCLLFRLSDECNASCFCVEITFEDGTTSTHNVTVGSGTTALCFDKAIASFTTFEISCPSGCRVSPTPKPSRSDIQQGSGWSGSNSTEVYPNPASGELTVKVSISGFEKGTVEVTSLDGKSVVLPSVIQIDTPRRLDVSSLGNGIYVVKVRDDSNRIVQLRKVVIQHP